jgi:hypothetical protein
MEVVSSNWPRQRLEKDLAELETLLQRARIESRGSRDDEVAEQLIIQLIRRRRLQLRST